MKTSVAKSTQILIYSIVRVDRTIKIKNKNECITWGEREW